MTDEEESELDPAEAFSLLGDPTRLEIVTALHDTVDAPASFSTLYDRVGIEDTGRFNYHRDQLVPHFVSKTDDGYELTAAGERIARAVAAGTYTDTPSLDPFEIDGACYACGEAALVASYEDERFRVECRACEELVVGVGVPPSVVRGRDPGDVVSAVDEWARAQVDQARRGICPDCGGAVETGVAEAVRETIQFEAVARFDCTVCGRNLLASFGGLAERHPVVDEFHRERGASLRDRPYWEVPQFVAGDHVEVLARDPWLVRASFFADGDACHVEIDGDLAIVETTVVRDP